MRPTRARKRPRQNFCRRLQLESLEPRQLMSLAIEVRGADGLSHAATVSAVGQVLNLQIWAIVSGQNFDAAQDGLQDLGGSFIAGNNGPGPLAGDLAAFNLAPFNANGSQAGTQQDLNGDGNVDVGSNDNSQLNGFFFARSGSLETTGVVSGANLTFEVGSLSYTVTNLNLGGQVDITFTPWMPPISTLGFAAVWREDNQARDNTNGVFTGGTPFVITAPSEQPGGPIAVADNFPATSGVPELVSVLQNDFDNTGALDPTTVTIVSPPDHGGVASVDPSTGAITYTADFNFVGNETLSYTVGDDQAAVSAPATVTFTATRPDLAPPVANDDAAATVLATPVSIDILSNDTAAAPASPDPSRVTLLTSPAHGVASLDTDGSILYTPEPDFVGADSFTYSFIDTNGNTSNPATVQANVGVAVTLAAGGRPSLRFLDADGTAGTIVLTRGTATLRFDGVGRATVARNRAVTVRAQTGSSLALREVSLSGTSAASVLAIASRGGDGVLAIGNILTTGGEAVGRILAPGGNLAGSLDVGGVSVLLLRRLTNAPIQIGSAIAAGTSIVLGDVTGSSIISAVPIRLLRVASWTNPFGSVVQAPSLTNFLSSGDFSASLNLTGTGSTLPTLGAARIGGGLIGGAWSITGNTSAVLAGSVTSAWTGNFNGALKAFLVRRGGLPANLTTTGALDTLLVVGDLTGNISAASARNVLVTGAIRNASFRTTGDILAIAAGSMSGATITAGATPGVDLGSNAIGSVRVTGRGPNVFSDTSIYAHRINAAVLGAVNTASTAPTGLVARLLSVVLLTANGKTVLLRAGQLTTQADLDAYLAGRAIDLGAVTIRIVP